MSSYYDDTISKDTWQIVFSIIIIIFLVLFGFSCSRSSNGMAKTNVNNLCYDVSSHIVYREEIVGGKSLNYHYEPYYNENGNMMTYDPMLQEFTEIIKEK